MVTKNNEENVVRVGILLMLFGWLQPNGSGNTKERLVKATELYKKKAVAMFGADVLNVPKRLSTAMVDGVMALCLDGEDTPKQSSIWRLIGSFFAMLGVDVGNLKGRSSTSAWTEKHRNAMVAKVLIWCGIGTGKDAGNFAWATVPKPSGGRGIDSKALINNFLDLTADVNIPLYEDLIGAEEEEVDDFDDLDDVSASDVEDFEMWDDGDEDDIDAGDAVIEGATAGQRLSNTLNHYKSTLNDTKVLAKKEKAHSWYMGMLYTLIGFASGDTPNLNLYYRKTKTHNKLNSLFYGKESLKAIAKGVGTEYTTEYKNTKTTKVVEDLRERDFQSLLASCAEMVMKSLHFQIKDSKAFYAFTKGEKIEYKSFFAYAVALVLNSLENGADANKLGYGFIREIKRVGNYDMYEAWLDHFKIDDGHEVFFAPMTNDNNDDTERQSGWDDWEADIIN